MNRTPRAIGTVAAARKAQWVARQLREAEAREAAKVAAFAAVHSASIRPTVSLVKGPKRDSQGRFVKRSVVA